MSMKFHDLCIIFERVEPMTSRTQIMHELIHIYQKATPIEARIITNLVLGQLEPAYKGTVSNMANKQLLPVVADVTGQSETKINQDFKKFGDLGSVIAQYTWHDKYPVTYPSITQVYQDLHTIYQISGAGAYERRSELVKNLCHRVDSLSAKYIVRIIVGKLHLGFSDMMIMDVLAVAMTGEKRNRTIIEHAYNICADLGYISELVIKHGLEYLKNIQVQIGIPVRPAAAERLPTPQAIFEKIGPCVAQPKIDGFRLQIHVDLTQKKPKVLFFSRNLLDVTYMFPELVTAAQKLGVKTLIAEGEAIVYDVETQEFLPFQVTAKRKRKHGIEEMQQEFPLKLFLFDIIYLNGQSLIQSPHHERRAALLHIAPIDPVATISAIQEVIIHTAEELALFFQHMISEGLEGIVVRRSDAHYQAGKRNFNWIKLKRETIYALEDTIDTVVLGYYAGGGKRAKFGIGAFLVGVYNDKQDTYETVAKVGTGLTDQEWIELKKKCDEYAVDHKPFNVECVTQLKPDVWVTPLLVCELQADELTISPLHTAGKTASHPGYALRFPRFIKWRLDKRPEQATTTHELRDIYQSQRVTKKD